MSMIEMKRMQATIDALTARLEALEKAIDATKDVVKAAVAPVETTAQDLEAKFGVMAKQLHDEINASVKATVDATLDVTKNELKAFAKSLVPTGGKKKGSSPSTEELAQE